MPLPFIIGVGAAVAGTIGVGAGLQGVAKMVEANDTIKSTEQSHKKNVNRFESAYELTSGTMDELGNLELNILKDFDKFSDTIEKIQNRPEFHDCEKYGINLPKYDQKEIEKVSIGAGVLLTGLSGAALGVAGGIAAAGATTSAVMAFGTASTGTAIASLSGAAATNATLAALGGGAIGGTIAGTGIASGGIGLGTSMLTMATAGVGLLVGGIVFSLSGNSMAEKAESAYSEMKDAEKTINEICDYLHRLRDTADDYISSLKKVKDLYLKWFAWTSFTVNNMHKTEWSRLTAEEKTAIQNTVMLVGLLYKMCKVNIVIKAESSDEVNKINENVIKESINEANKLITELS